MEANRVKVRIYGQEYTIAGDKKEEDIRQIAAYVDSTMKELGRSFSTNGQSVLAVLTAINIADQLFDAKEETNRLEENEKRLKKETEHYLKMWEEAKKSFIQYKDSSARLAEEKEQNEEKYKELQERCSEFENSFYDLQMENLHLKRELEEYKKSDEI